MANPEFIAQVAIVKWLRIAMPTAIIQHCVNEVNMRGRAGMLKAARQKSAGVFSGFPDLIVLPAAGTGAFFLEVKSKVGRTSKSQDEAHGMLRHLGYPVAVVKTVDDVRAFLDAESIPHNEVMF